MIGILICILCTTCSPLRPGRRTAWQAPTNFEICYNLYIWHHFLHLTAIASGSRHVLPRNRFTFAYTPRQQTDDRRPHRPRRSPQNAIEMFHPNWAGKASTFPEWQGFCIFHNDDPGAWAGATAVFWMLMIYYDMSPMVQFLLAIYTRVLSSYRKGTKYTKRSHVRKPYKANMQKTYGIWSTS